MDDLFTILFFASVIILLPWILLARSRRLRKKAQEDFDYRFADLTSRVFSVEEALTRLRNRLDSELAVGSEVSPRTSAVEKRSSPIPAQTPQPPPPVSRAAEAIPSYATSPSSTTEVAAHPAGNGASESAP